MNAFPMHSFHPPLVHLPLIAFGLAVLLDGIDAFSAEPRRRAAATLIWWLAFAGAAAAIATGLLAYGRVDHSEAGHEIMTLHRNLALSSVAVLLISFLARWRLKRPKLTFALGVLGVTGLTAVGYLGGEMVFRHAVGIPTPDLGRIEAERGVEEEGHTHPQDGAPGGHPADSAKSAVDSMEMPHEHRH